MKFKQVADDDPSAVLNIPGLRSLDELIGADRIVLSQDSRCWHVDNIPPRAKSNAEIAHKAAEEIYKNRRGDAFLTILDAVDAKDAARARNLMERVNECKTAIAVANQRIEALENKIAKLEGRK